MLAKDDSPGRPHPRHPGRGRRAVRSNVTRYVVEHGRQAIEWLIGKGVPFTRDETSDVGYHLTREGGHSHRRVIHAADATGHAVQTTLEAKIKAHPNITVLEHHIAVDLITGGQARAWPSSAATASICLEREKRTGGRPSPQTRWSWPPAAPARSTCTPPIPTPRPATASPWAGAPAAGWPTWNSSSSIPTCLYHPHAKSFLIIEAVRGEGGILRLPDGTRFMPAHDQRAELAPRDVVARAIDFEMKKRGLDCVYLDITHKPAEFLQRALSQYLRPLPGVRHRHRAAADPGGAGGALHLRRRPDRPATAAPTSPACMRSAKRRIRGCTAPTAWPAIRCWNAWYSARPRATPHPAASPSRRHRPCRNGTKAASPMRTRKS